MNLCVADELWNCKGILCYFVSFYAPDGCCCLFCGQHTRHCKLPEFLISLFDCFFFQVKRRAVYGKDLRYILFLFVSKVIDFCMQDRSYEICVL